ncbi:MAG: hypothetical protein ACK4ND_01320 [Cytophagaceae bacterium]
MLLRKNFLLILLIATSSIGIAFCQDEKTIIPKWKTGDKKEIEEEVLIQYKIRDVKIPDTKFSTKHRIHVKDVQEEFILIHYQYLSDFSLSFMGSAMQQKMLDGVLNSKEIEDMVYEVMLDKEGNVVDLINWQIIQGKMKKFGENLINALDDKFNIPAQKKDSLLNNFYEDFSNKEKVMQQTLQSLEYMLSGYGVPYKDKGETRTSGEVYSTMNYYKLNETGLPAVYVSKISANSSSSMDLNYSIEYDKDMLISQIRKSEELEEEDDFSEQVELKENRTYRFVKYNGWFTYINLETSLLLKGMGEIKISNKFKTKK